MNLAEPISQRLNRIQQGAIVVAVVALIIGFIGMFADATHWVRAYLVAYIFWLELSLGCLGLLLLTNLVKSKWGFTTQRLLAAGARTIPLMVILFLPVLIGLRQLYPWATNVATEINYGEDAYFRGPVFVIRAVIYFILWSGFAYIVTGWLYRSDSDNDVGTLKRSQRFSALGIIVFFITVTFSSLDWIMAVDSHWFSSVYGWMSIARMGILTIAMLIIAVTVFSVHDGLRALLTERVTMDLAVILLVALMSWIYLSFIQFFVMWSGNLPYEVFYYIDRIAGGWQGWLVILIALHAFTLFLMLTPGIKRVWGIVLALAVLMIIGRYIELVWLIMPSYGEGIPDQFLDIMLVIGLGGVWVYAFIWVLKQQELVPASQPDPAEFVGSAQETEPAPAGT